MHVYIHVHEYHNATIVCILCDFTKMGVLTDACAENTGAYELGIIEPR